MFGKGIIDESRESNLSLFHIWAHQTIVGCDSLFFSGQTHPVPPRTVTGRVYSMGHVSAQKRELLLWEVKTCKIHPVLKTKPMTNQSDTYIKLKSWRTITECSTCNAYRILTRKVSLCVGCNLERIFFWQVNHVKTRLLANFLLSCFRVWCIYVSQSLIYLSSTVGSVWEAFAYLNTRKNWKL